MAIECSFPKDPLQVLYFGISFLQRWLLLLKQPDHEKVIEIWEKLTGWASMADPRGASISNIVEI